MSPPACPALAAAASLVLSAEKPWSPATHSLWPDAARAFARHVGRRGAGLLRGYAEESCLQVNFDWFVRPQVGRVRDPPPVLVLMEGGSAGVSPRDGVSGASPRGPSGVCHQGVGSRRGVTCWRSMRRWMGAGSSAYRFQMAQPHAACEDSTARRQQRSGEGSRKVRGGFEEGWRRRVIFTGASVQCWQTALPAGFWPKHIVLKRVW